MLAGKLYIIGGKKLVSGSEANSRATYVYDPANKTLSTKAQLPADFHHISAAAAYGKIYLVGSPSATSTSKSLYEYSPVTNQWTLLTSVNTAYSGLTSVVFWNSRIYMITAYSSSLRTVVTYDPVTGTTETKPNITLNSSASYRTHTAVFNGELYLISPMTYSYLKCTNTGGTDSWSAGTWNLYAYPSTVLLGSNFYSFYARELNPRDSYFTFSITLPPLQVVVCGKDPIRVR
ncbi:MAG: hypothetical protein LBL49_00910 [Clostridiales Family XIII bacterium]|jgi:hypothetical protein|nr:hypothetical protein [Clostridiales Family XIII bacterium]